MQQNRNIKIKQRRKSRADLRTLVRSPAVLALLVATAATQGVGAALGGGAKDGAARPLALHPVVVAPAMEELALRESLKLAEKYRAEGYEVPEDLALEIHEAASENGIDPDVAFGLVRAESSFRNSSTSPVGAVGLTQLMPATARWLEPGVTRTELRNPETNLRIGFRYLRDLIDKYKGDVDLALLAYNRGPGTVDRALKRGRNPDNGYAAFVRGRAGHGHKLFTH